jgi:hypothetical protein
MENGSVNNGEVIDSWPSWDELSSYPSFPELSPNPAPELEEVDPPDITVD